MIYAILILTNLLTLAGLTLAVRRSLGLVEKLDEITVQVEESLDIIDESYASVSKHLESPVLFDDPVVIAMIQDVKSARNSMLLIANKISEPFNDDISFEEKKKGSP